MMNTDFLRWLELAADGVQRLRASYAVWQPITQLPQLLQPFFALGAVLTVAVVTGISLSALTTLIVSLLVLQFLLVDVFGLTLEVRVP